NRTLAQKCLGGASNAIGKRLRVGTGNWRTVIGVAADVKYARLDESPTPFVYLPFFQAYRSSMTLHTRGAAPENVLVDQARARIAALDPELPLIHARPMANETRGATVLLEFMSVILFIFGTAGMALAA